MDRADDTLRRARDTVHSLRMQRKSLSRAYDKLQKLHSELLEAVSRVLPISKKHVLLEDAVLEAAKKLNDRSQESEQTYSGHIMCHRCGHVHWKFGSCIDHDIAEDGVHCKICGKAVYGFSD